MYVVKRNIERVHFMLVYSFFVPVYYYSILLLGARYVVASTSYFSIYSLIVLIRQYSNITICMFVHVTLMMTSCIRTCCGG